MQRESATFNAAGGPLSVKLENGHANSGQYDLTLLTPDGLGIVHQWPRSDLSSSHTHTLPGDAASQDGRAVDAVAAIGLLDPSKAFAVTMTAFQDGGVIGSVRDSGNAPEEQLSHVVELILDFRDSASRMASGSGRTKKKKKPTKKPKKKTKKTKKAKRRRS